MFIVGIILIILGVIELFIAYGDNSFRVLISTYAICGIGFIISGTICICVRIAINEICDELSRISDKLNDGNKVSMKHIYNQQEKKLDYYDLPDSY